MASKQGSLLLIVGAVVAGILLTRKAGASPTGFICPVDGLSFGSQEELIAHMTATHPGVRVPIAITWG